MVAWEYTSVKNDQIVHQKSVHLIVHKLYFIFKKMILWSSGCWDSLTRFKDIK